MRKAIPFLLLIQLLLTGCWDYQEFEESAFVQGVGIDKEGKRIKVYTEITKPSGGQEGSAGGQSSGQHVILEIKADTLIEAFRGLIRTAKRRLDFTHTQIFIISENLAKDVDIPVELDLIRRDTMLRLNSYLFITDKDPTEIFNTPTLYKSLTSNELASVIEHTKFITEYLPVYNYEFYRFLTDHHNNAYIPIISIQKAGKQKVTAITGTAVIKDNKMVGKLNKKESAGLNWLLDYVKGGSVSVEIDPQSRFSLEVTDAKTKIKPYIEGNQLKVDIHTKVVGTFADNVTQRTLNKAFKKDAESKIAKEVEKLMRSSLKKLQGLQTDITDFELNLRRRDPKEWQRVKSDWDELYANAEVNYDIDVTFIHRGMNNESWFPEQGKPTYNPYRYLKLLFGR
ncbi:Ger(x)C family spore germination protein [Bacillus marasmi]|uniref:Ger(x)C family spore germination protein n=1 Tax=Bacillus marasmi TaxID=1926279 RepID=UPI0011C9F563|nr:Ger(x)C family spore germination protein [Bacillus marasmi]